MKKEIIMASVIIITLTLLAILAINNDKLEIRDEQNSLVMSQEQKAWLAQKEEISIGISQELLYLVELGEDGYCEEGLLAEYIQSITEKLNVRCRIVPMFSDEYAQKSLNNGVVDGVAVVVNDNVRNSLSYLKVTKPVIKIKNSVFIASDIMQQQEAKDSLKGIVINSAMTSEGKDGGKQLSYNGIPFITQQTESIEDLDVLLENVKVDGIIGDQMAIAGYLRERQLQDDFTDTDFQVNMQNVCILIREDQTLFHDMMNQAIQSTEGESVLGQLQSKWFGISYSLKEENSFKDFTMFLLIVFASVLCAFFLYYLSNKNLYEELTNRMEQLVSSKREMKTTFNSVSYYMAELDETGMVLDVNKAFLRFIEPINTEVIGLSVWNTMKLPQDQAMQIKKEIEKTVESNEGQHIEITYGKIILDIDTFPIENSKGEIEKILFMASNVTRIRMAERQLLQDNKMIAVGQLAAGVAHEIRNPLGLIRNYCYLLKNMSPEDEEQKRQAIHIIEKSVESSSKIITNLLNFSRKNTMEKEIIYIRNHIDSVVSLNYGSSKKKQIKIYVNCIEDFQANICVESLDMVLINLLSNAMDAIHESGKIVIDIYKYEYDFSIVVTDSGEGINEETLPEIFNPFFTTKKYGHGNGLGLYIVYNEIQKMDGKINVSSEINKGTTFKVDLPL